MSSLCCKLFCLDRPGADGVVRRTQHGIDGWRNGQVLAQEGLDDGHWCTNENEAQHMAGIVDAWKQGLHAARESRVKFGLVCFKFRTQLRGQLAEVRGLVRLQHEASGHRLAAAPLHQRLDGKPSTATCPITTDPTT